MTIEIKSDSDYTKAKEVVTTLEPGDSTLVQVDNIFNFRNYLQTCNKAFQRGYQTKNRGSEVVKGEPVYNVFVVRTV